MKRFALILGLFLLGSAAAEAQTVSGSITAANAACMPANCTRYVFPVSSNIGTIAIQIGGTFGATLQFEAVGGSESTGLTYVSIAGAPISGGVPVTSTSAPGVWQFSASGLYGIQVRASAYASGTATTILQSSLAPTGGSGTAGTVTSNVNIASINNVAINPSPAGFVPVANFDANGNPIVNGTTQPVAQQASTPIFGTLQAAAVASGAGTPMAILGESTVLLYASCTVTCSGGTQINFLISQNGTNYKAITAARLDGDRVSQSSFLPTTDSVWSLMVPGGANIEATITNYSAGTITITATTVPVGNGVPLGNAGNDCFNNSGTGTPGGGSAVPVTCKTIGGGILSIEALTSGITAGTTAGFLRLYNGTPTCSSATGFVRSIPIPAPGISFNFASPEADKFTSGVGYCISLLSANNDNTAPPALIFVNLRIQ